jgi:hypothetical protein
MGNRLAMYKVRIRPSSEQMDHARQIVCLHSAISGRGAWIEQDLRPNAPTRFPYDKGYVLVVMTDVIPKEIILAWVKQFGFTYDPGSETESRLVSVPSATAVATI